MNTKRPDYINPVPKKDHRPRRTAKQRQRRNDARLRIVQAVNNFKLGYRPFGFNGPQPVLFDTNTLQQAVHIARQRKLVQGQTLEAAGFNKVRS